MHLSHVVAGVVLGLLSIPAYLGAAEESPFLEGPPAAAATQPGTRPAWLPEDLQQRRQAAKTLYEQDLATQQKLLLDAYAASGCTNSRWDNDARKAILAYAASENDDHHDGSPWFESHRSCFWADRENCDDALIAYISARMAHWVGFPTPADDTRQIEAGRKLQDSEYPDSYKALGLLRMMQFLALDSAKSGKSHEDEIEEARMQVLDLAQSIAKAQPIPRYQLRNLIYLAGEASHDVYRDRMKLVSELLTVLGDGYADRSALLAAEGARWIDYAWDARGNDWGSTVTAQGWDQFGKRLDHAETLLVKAWELDHDNASPARMMIILCMGKSYPRPTMEKWFKAAVAAEPDAPSAYDIRLDYLEPKWHGSPEEMIQFGRECLALPDDSPCRLTIASVHLRLSRYDDPDYKVKYVRGYFGKSADKIWPDIQAAYEPYIKACGLSDHIRLSYARLALWCKQPDKARELLRDYTKYAGHRDMNLEDVNAMRKELGLPAAAMK